MRLVSFDSNIITVYNLLRTVQNSDINILLNRIQIYKNIILKRFKDHIQLDQEHFFFSPKIVELFLDIP